MSSVLSQALWVARVCLLVTVRRGAGDGAGGDGTGGDGADGDGAGGDGAGGDGAGGGGASGDGAGGDGAGCDSDGVKAGKTGVGLSEVACTGLTGTRRRLGGVKGGGVDGRGGIVSGSGRCLSALRSTKS